MEITYSNILATAAILISLGSLLYSRKKYLFEASLQVAEYTRSLKEILNDEIVRLNKYIADLEALLKMMDGCEMPGKKTEELELLWKNLNEIKKNYEKQSRDAYNIKMDANPIVLTCLISDTRKMSQNIQGSMCDFLKMQQTCKICKSIRHEESSNATIAAQSASADLDVAATEAN